jgi:predicted restriction endonuclease
MMNFIIKNALRERLLQSESHHQSQINLKVTLISQNNSRKLQILKKVALLHKISQNIALHMFTRKTVMELFSYSYSHF